MLFSLVPTLANPVVADDSGRDANIRLSVSPGSQTVNPGETAEYTVRVYNDGSNPVSVNLAATNDQDCSGYSSTIGQIGQPIEAGDYGETFLNVTLAQTAEGSCVTTVTANANEQPEPPEQPGQPAQATKEVETSSGDGSGSTLFGVDLTISAPVNPTWNGEDEIEWEVEVENTGRVQETVELTVDPRSGSGCKSDGSLNIDVNPSSVQIDNGSSEWVTVTVQIPEGKESDKYCWEIEGVVTNDQNPNGSASDTEEFSLFIPELKKCDLTLSKSSLSLEPGETGSLVATFSNEGNTDWSISVNFNGTKSNWATVDGPSSGNLNYNDGNGEKEFTIEITPDDSVEANSQSTFYIEGKDGNQWKCRDDVSVTVGQSRGATISLGNTAIYEIPPGQDETTTLTVTNTGNGQETFKVAASSLPTGWSVTLESSTISTQSRFNNAEKSGTIEVMISLPLDALATEEVTIVFSVLPQNSGGAYDTAELLVTVKPIHGMSGESPADDQTGRISGNPATDLYAGMNRVSAMGNLERAGERRIDTREKTAYYVVVAILLMTAYTSVNLPFAALSTEITQETSIRTRLNAARFTGSILAGLSGLILAAGFLSSTNIAGINQLKESYLSVGKVTGLPMNVPNIAAKIFTLSDLAIIKANKT